MKELEDKILFYVLIVVVCFVVFSIINSIRISDLCDKVSEISDEVEHLTDEYVALWTTINEGGNNGNSTENNANN